jgi:hypothetical protein
MLLDLGMECGVRVEDGEDVRHYFVSPGILPRERCQWGISVREGSAYVSTEVAEVSLVVSHARGVGGKWGD